MRVPLLDLRPQHLELEEELREAIARVLGSGRFILGPEVSAFEQEIAEYCGCRFGIGVSSGTDALLVALMALGIGPGDEIITSPYSFFASSACISRLGARPVFVDVEPGTCNIDANRIEQVVTARTKAILPIHLFGQTADMSPIVDIALRKRLAVVEDASQAIGARYSEKRAGSLGDIGCFSLYPSKNLGACGDAGIVTTDDSDLAEKIRLLRNHGERPKYTHSLIGGNFRLDELQAAILRVKLSRLEGWNERRRANCRRYEVFFQEEGLTTATGDSGRVSIPREIAGRRHIFNQYVVRVDRRDALREHLNAAGIGCEVYYPIPLHLQDCFSDLGYREGDFPHSEDASRETLALPIYPGLSEEHQTRVVRTIEAFYS